MRSLLTRRRSRLALGVAVALTLVAAPGVTSVSAVGAAAAPTPAPIKVIQNHSEILNPGSSFHCPTGGASWLRRFDLAVDHGSGTGFRLERVVIGHDSVSPTGETGTIDLEVQAHTIDPDEPLLLANLDLLASAPLMISAAESHTVTSTPLPGNVPAGKHLVISVVDSGLDGAYFVGGNDQPESTPAYVVAADCGAFEPTPTTNYYPHALMFYAVGTSQDCLSATDAVATAEQAVATAKAKFKKAAKTYKKAKKKYKKAKRKGSRSTSKKAKRKYKKATRAYVRARTRHLSAKSDLFAARQTAGVECAQPPTPEAPLKPQHRDPLPRGFVSGG